LIILLPSLQLRERKANQELINYMQGKGIESLAWNGFTTWSFGNTGGETASVDSYRFKA
jgi:hypothetical protein